MLLKLWRTKAIITQNLYDHIRKIILIIPRSYGLPKVQRPGLLLRPILNTPNSPCHRIAQWLAEKLESGRRQESKYSVHDTFQFIDSIKNSNTSEKPLFSIVVSSLFTSVPLIGTICYMCGYINPNNMDINLLTEHFTELLVRCTF